MAAYFFASPVDIDVRLEGEDDRKKVEIKADKEKMVSCPVYYDGESVAGQVWLPLLARASLRVAIRACHHMQTSLKACPGDHPCTRRKEVGA